MRALFITMLVLLAFPHLDLSAQTVPGRSYMRHGIVHHSASSATVVVNAPRPLLQAITAVRDQYGWTVDYEDPPYQSNYDLIKATFPNGTAIMLPSGQGFQSTYSEPSDIWSNPNDEQPILNKIVSDYNGSGNPGTFLVRTQADGSYAIIGTAVRNASGSQATVSPILDTTISIPSGTLNADQMIALILNTLSSKAGIRVDQGTMPTNLLIQSQVTMTGLPTSARNLLLQVIADTNRKLVWELLYDASSHSYGFNLLFATRAVQGTFGQNQPLSDR